MSRYVLTPKPNTAQIMLSGREIAWSEMDRDTHTLAFGYMNDMGIWMQVQSPRSTRLYSSLMDGLSKSQLLDAIDFYASPEELVKYKYIRDRIVLDQPF